MVRPHLGAGAPWLGRLGHRLRVVGLSLGPDSSSGYDQIQFGVLVGFCNYSWFAPSLNTLCRSALSRVIYAFPCVKPEIDTCNKTCGKVSPKALPSIYFIYKMIYIINTLLSANKDS